MRSHSCRGGYSTVQLWVESVCKFWQKLVKTIVQPEWLMINRSWLLGIGLPKPSQWFLTIMKALCTTGIVLALLDMKGIVFLGYMNGNQGTAAGKTLRQTYLPRSQFTTKASNPSPRSTKSKHRNHGCNNLWRLNLGSWIDSNMSTILFERQQLSSNSPNPWLLIYILLPPHTVLLYRPKNEFDRVPVQKSRLFWTTEKVNWVFIQSGRLHSMTTEMVFVVPNAWKRTKEVVGWPHCLENLAFMTSNQIHVSLSVHYHPHVSRFWDCCVKESRTCSMQSQTLSGHDTYPTVPYTQCYSLNLPFQLASH